MKSNISSSATSKTPAASISVLRGHTAFVLSVAVSSDGKRIASGSQDFIVWNWDVETGKIVEDSLFQGHTDSVLSVA